MDALIWSARFFTGLATVDEQHHRLVDLINEFGELCARYAEVPRARLDAVVDELSRYAVTHFTDEERLMTAAGLDRRFLEAHQRQHAHFLRDVQGMRASRFLEKPETARVLLRFLLHWLAFHILGADMQAARQIERLGRGETAAAAFTAEVHQVSGPAELLLGALDDLMRVIAVRNGELLAANELLEARVAQRTAELTNTLEALRSTQGKLVESAKLASIGQLASGVAHELNNPLAFVTANMRSLEEYVGALGAYVDDVDAQVPPEVKAALAGSRKEHDVDFVREDLGTLLGESKQGLKRVADIVSNLKDFSRVDAPAAELDLKSCAEATLKIFPTKLREGVTFRTEFAATPRISCDAAQVNQAILALLVNAAQAVRQKGSGQVTLRVGVEEKHAFVEVEDTGVGMSPEVLARATEPFFTTRPPGQGVGLGLTTAYNCGLAHGGRLDGRSTPGEGTTFRLALSLETRDSGITSLSNDFNTRRY